MNILKLKPGRYLYDKGCLMSECHDNHKEPGSNIQKLLKELKIKLIYIANYLMQ
mgnify:CR=1 FL=1|jgi:hypothetical protein